MTTPLHRTLLFSLAAALAGCHIQKPEAVVPPAATIESFTASATSIEQGGEVTLTWKVTNATALSLLNVETGDLGVGTTTFEGSTTVTVTTNARFVLSAQGAGGSDARALAVVVTQPLAKVSLDAMPTVVAGGGATSLVWFAPGASTASLTANGTALDTSGQVTAGALTLTPLEDTTYVLTTDLGTAQTQVTVQPAVVTLVSTPASTSPGGSVTLTWTTAGAEGLTISTEARGTLYTATAADLRSGSFVDTVPVAADGGVASPGGAETYLARATKGAETFERTLVVPVATAPRIDRFEAPTVVSSGALCQVRWQTTAATAVELRVDGSAVFTSADPARVGLGYFQFIAQGDRPFTLELVAINAAGVEASRVISIDTVGPPTSLNFSASPGAVAFGSPVTLTWDAPGSRRVRVTDSNNEAVFGATTTSGTATVYLPASTTLTMVADNLLGSTLSQTADVVVTGSAPTLTRTPATPATGQSLTVNSATAVTLHGFPHAQVLTASDSSFIDISATGQRVLVQGSDVVAVPVTFASRLWGQRVGDSITISRAGWMAFNAPTTINATETALPSTATNAPPGLIAPYWDTLTMTANSAVFVQVLGDAPNETLVVQWNRLQAGSTVASELTFQARLTQHGILSFHYKTMTLNVGPSFTSGVQDLSRTVAVTAVGTPTANTARYFFTPAVPPVATRVTSASRYGGFVQVGEVYAPLDTPSGAVVPGQEISISEVMFRPVAAVGNAGQYVELMNNTTAPLDLGGWRLGSLGTFELPSGFVLQPGVPAVVGASTDTALNDDAGVALAWGVDFSLPFDGGSVLIGQGDAGATRTLTRPTDGGVGTAVEFDTTLLSVGGTVTSCLSTASYGSQVPSQRGSPARRWGCNPYLKDVIPGAFVTAPGGSQIPPSTWTVNNLTSGYGTATLPAPFTYFGTTVTTVGFSVDGVLTLGGTFTAAQTTNPTAVSTTLPNGTLGVFWDDLDLTTNAGTISMWRAGDRTIISWENNAVAANVSLLNFQAHLLDTGVIEFHYGTMTGAVPARVAGNSATVWLESPDGTTAVPFSINTATLQPNTGIRFTPR